VLSEGECRVPFYQVRVINVKEETLLTHFKFSF
jgi:hypothetical protein